MRERNGGDARPAADESGWKSPARRAGSTSVMTCHVRRKRGNVGSSMHASSPAHTHATRAPRRAVFRSPASPSTRQVSALRVALRFAARRTALPVRRRSRSRVVSDAAHNPRSGRDVWLHERHQGGRHGRASSVGGKDGAHAERAAHGRHGDVRRLEVGARKVEGARQVTGDVRPIPATNDGNDRSARPSRERRTTRGRRIPDSPASGTTASVVKVLRPSRVFHRPRRS